MSIRNALIALTAAAVLGTVAAPAVAADQPMIVNIKRLSLEVALKIARTAIDTCRKEGVQVAVTVVDRGGHPQVVLRDVLAMDITVPVSRMKAHTALAFNSPTSTLENRFKGAYSVPKLDDLLIAAGGVPVEVGGSIVAGVGVSGAPSGDIDQKCAQAGVDAVQADLEMAGM